MQSSMDVIVMSCANSNLPYRTQHGCNCNPFGNVATVTMQTSFTVSVISFILCNNRNWIPIVKYYSNGVTRRCNTLVIIKRHLSEVQVLYYITQLPHEIQTLAPIYSWYCKSPIRMPCFKTSQSFFGGGCD